MSVNQRHAITPPKGKEKRYGKNYWGIDFECNENLTNEDYLNHREVQPIAGELLFNDKLRIPVTISEINRLIQTLEDARTVTQQRYRLGFLK